MKRRVTLISIILCAAMLLGVVSLCRTSVKAASGPLLYWNDRNWLRESRQGIEQIYGVYYVPLTLFNQPADIDVRTNSSFNSFIIIYGEKYLSFDVEKDCSLNENGERGYVKIYEMHGDYYVPVKTICDYLGIGLEMMTSTVTGETAIRITDGNQTKSFRDMIRDKYPSFFEQSTSRDTTPQVTAPPVTEPPVTTPPVQDTTEPLEERTIYLTFEDCPGEFTEDILETLKSYGYKATFFVTGENIAEKPELLSKIAAEGHEIALHTMEHDEKLLTDATAILADIEAENELLGAIIKRKSHIWRAPEGSKSLESLTSEVERELNRAGYLVWDYNLEPTGRTVKIAADRLISGIRRNETPVIRFPETEYTNDILKRVLDFIEENKDVCTVLAITPAMREFNVIEN